MNEKIVPFKVIETNDEQVHDIFLAGSMAGFCKALVIGVYDDGDINLSHTAMTDAEANWLMDMAKARLINGDA